MIIHSLKGQGLSVASRDEAEKAGPNLRPVKIFAEVMQDRLPGRYVRMYRVVQNKNTIFIILRITVGLRAIFKMQKYCYL